MADQFNQDLQQQNHNHLKPSLSNMELLNMGNSATAAAIGNFNSPNVNGLMAFSSDGHNYSDHDHPHQRHHLPLPNFMDANIQSSLIHPHDSPSHHHLHGPFYDPITHFLPASDQAGPSLESGNFRVHSSPQVFSSGIVGESRSNRNHGYGGKKRKRNNEQLENEKAREVVHVRARRGQATDSHSLAERLRREKINEKLRCLQDLVPGCYKTMGMAVMLDVIINYVRSLQNQIEFLSMKLSAASLFYDFNSSEMEALDAMQGANGYDQPQVVERMVGEGYGGAGLPQFQSAWPSL